MDFLSYPFIIAYPFIREVRVIQLVEITAELAIDSPKRRRQFEGEGQTSLKLGDKKSEKKVKTSFLDVPSVCIPDIFS